jgi:hypothetical protein
MGSVRVFALRLLRGAWKLNSLLICLSAVALAAACGGSRATLPDEPGASPGLGPAALPPPSALRQASYDPARLVCCGYEYITAAGFPRQNICAADQCCEFTPDWTPAAPDPGGLAYACYGFDMEGYDRPQQVTFSWAEQGDPADLWIGLADFQRNCWSWHSVGAGDILALELAPYIDAETHRMLVLPLVTGSAAWQLSRIHVGDLATLTGVVLSDDGMIPLYDAQVVLDGDQEYAVRTDYEGKWRIDGVLPGDYEARAELIGYSFTPESQQITVDALQHVLDDFVGTPQPVHDVSGMVFDDKAAPLRGVELVIKRQESPYGSVSAWTEFDGSWLTGLPDGDYTVTPELACWTFTPFSRDFSLAGGPVVVGDFVGEKLPGYLLDGYVYQSDGSTPLPDVQVTVTNDELQLWYYASSDIDGYWYVPEVIDGGYTVEPQLYGWRFEPPLQSVTVAGANLRVDPFIGGELSQYIVDGYVYLDDGVTPLGGISVQLSGDWGWFYATTSSSGRYVFMDVYEGEYVVIPTDIGYSFEPAERAVTIGADTTVEPFLATALPTYIVDGHVYRPDGTTGVEGVYVMVYAYMPPGTTFETYTDSEGYWQIPGIPSGYYTVWPQKQGYTFEPPDQAIMVEDADLTVDDFIGTSLPSYMMHGYVYEQDGTTPLPGVTLDVYGWSYYYEATTDASGHWVLDEVFEDTYSVTPMLAPWQFTPANREATVSGGDVLVPPFLGEELPAWLVDGYIYEIDSSIPVPDVRVWFYGATLNFYCTSDASGHYEILLPADSWEAWPSSDCWSFDPYMQALTVSVAPVTLDVFYAIPGG